MLWKLKEIPPEEPLDSLQAERTTGVSIKPFSKLKAPGSPVPPDRVASIDKASEITVAVTGLMRKISHQVEHDNKQTKKEIDKLLADIAFLEQARKENKLLLENLSSSLSDSLEAELKLIEEEAGRTLYDIATDANSSETLSGNKFHKSSKSLVEQRSVRSANEFRSARKNRKGVEPDGSRGVQDEYLRNGYSSRKKRPNDAAKRDSTSHWLLEFGLKRRIPFVNAKVAVDLRSALFNRDSATSPSRPDRAEHVNVKPRTEPFKNMEANSDITEDSVWRANIAVLETQSVVSRLGLASLNYCDSIARRSTFIAPAGPNSEQRQLADEISGFLIDKNLFPSSDHSAAGVNPNQSSLMRRREVSGVDV